MPIVRATFSHFLADHWNIPANRFERFKAKYAPVWLLRRWPVKVKQVSMYDWYKYWDKPIPDAYRPITRTDVQD